jgi:hypothetical protein
MTGTDWNEYLKKDELPGDVPENTLRKRKQRAKEREEKDVVSRNWDSKVEVKVSDIPEILTERGINHERVLEVLPGLIEVAARNLRIPLNHYLVSHGVQAALRARELKQPVEVPEVEDKWYPGSRIRRQEEFALWDFGMSWRETNGKRYTFEEFLELRRVATTDIFLFGKEILGLDVEDQPHGKWARELFVQKNPDLLPETYTWVDVKKAIAAQSPIHKRILAASRSSFKSSFNLVNLLSWVLVFGGDIRIFIISSTRPLSSGFLKKFRAYWTVKNPNEPTLFNQLYPEFMVQPVDDAGSAKSFTSPMRRLDLIQPTLNSSSLDSEGLAGERMDLFVAEDIAEISNSSTKEQRQKTLEKFLMLLELLEPFGYLQIVGTPISAGSDDEDDPGDIYTAMLEREKAPDDKQLLYQIYPAWSVKEGIKKKAWDPTLTADEVELLFPERLTFGWLMAKLKENLVTDKSAKVFRQQSLCMWVPETEEDLKIHFDPDLLTRSVIAPGAVPAGDTVLSVDIAYSLSARADLTSIAVLRFFTGSSGLKSAVVLDVEADRLRNSELAHRLVMLTRQHNPRTVLVEKGPSWESLDQQVRLVGAKYGVSVPLHFVTPSRAKGAKMARIKDLEFLLDAGRLKFRSGDYIDALFAELEKIDGGVSSRNKKDDRADSIAQATHVFKVVSSPQERTPEESKELAELQAEAIRKASYGRIFGSGEPNKRTPTVIPTAPNQPSIGQRWASYQQARAAAIRAQRGH